MTKQLKVNSRYREDRYRKRKSFAYIRYTNFSLEYSNNNFLSH